MVVFKMEMVLFLIKKSLKIIAYYPSNYSSLHYYYHFNEVRAKRNNVSLLKDLKNIHMGYSEYSSRKRYIFED